MVTKLTSSMVKLKLPEIKNASGYLHLVLIAIDSIYTKLK